MKEFKNLEELIIKAEEIVLRIEDVNEEQDRMRLALNKVTNDTRQAVIRMGNMIEVIPKIEEHVDIISNKINGIDAEKIRKEIDNSLSGISIEFDQEVINKSMNLRLSKLFKAMHLDKFTSHIDSHIVDYKAQCKQIDTNIKKLQAINDVTDRLEKHIPNIEHSLSRVQTKEYFIHWVIWGSLGAVSGSILTYFIMQ